MDDTTTLVPVFIRGRGITIKRGTLSSPVLTPPYVTSTLFRRVTGPCNFFSEDKKTPGSYGLTPSPCPFPSASSSPCDSLSPTFGSWEIPPESPLWTRFLRLDVLSLQVVPPRTQELTLREVLCDYVTDTWCRPHPSRSKEDILNGPFPNINDSLSVFFSVFSKTDLDLRSQRKHHILTFYWVGIIPLFIYYLFSRNGKI